MVTAVTQRFFETTRGRVLHLLRLGPRTVDELALRLSLTDNAVRAHLHTLERDGFVHAVGRRKGEGAGKPAVVFAITPGAEVHLSEAYVPVLRALLEAAAGTLPASDAERLVRDAARRLARGMAQPGDRDLSPGNRAAAVLRRLGGLVDVEEHEASVVVAGHGCPVSALVRDHPDVCHLVRTVLAETTGMRVRDHCGRDETTGRPACRFTLEDASP